MRYQVEGLIKRSLIALSEDDSLKSAVRIMHDNTISCIPVLQSGKPVGILTERGMVNILAGSHGRLNDTPLSRIMSSPVITVSADTLIYEALHVFVNKEIRHLVIVDDVGRAIGIITLSDIVAHVGSDIIIEFQDISRYMSRVILTLSPAENLSRVLAEMAKHTISCVIIAENEKPAGILTERDVVRLAWRGDDLSLLRAGDVMSSPVVQVRSASQVYQVTDLMRDRGIRRVVVVDDEGAIIGLATQTNIMRGLESNYIKILKQVIREQDNRINSKTREINDLSQYLMTILNTSIDMAIVATDQDFRIIYFNSCAQEILGYDQHEAMGRRVQDIHREQGIETERFSRIIDEVQSRETYSFGFERPRGEEILHFQARVSAIRSPAGSDNLGYVFMVQDITVQKRAEENMRYMAYHDILTGLPNRVAFTERLDLELARAARNKSRLAVMVVDINHFKEVNDIYGHFTGDLLLQAVAERLGGAIRRSDTVARVGGDEFMIILAELGTDEDAVAIAQKLMEGMKKPVDLKGIEYTVSISVGMSFFPEHAHTPRRLGEQADQAMYRAKRLAHRNGESKALVYCHEENRDEEEN